MSSCSGGSELPSAGSEHLAPRTGGGQLLFKVQISRITWPWNLEDPVT